MAKISSYTADSSIAGTEKLIGTDTDGTTLNYSLSDIATFMAGSGITATNGVLSVDSNDAITAGTGIDISSGTVSVDVSDFMTNGTDNYILTATGTDAINAEANLQMDGTTFAVTALQTITSTTADQFKVLYDGSNYGLMNVSSAGHVEIESVGTAADMTLNSARDILLNADGGNVYIQDASITHFDFDCDNTQIKIYDDTDTSDYLAFAVAANGYSVISTNDNDGTAGTLVLDPDGKLLITPADITGDVFHLDADADTDNIVNIDAGALDVDATAAITIDGVGVSIDSAGVAANFSVATDGAAEDLTIGLTGATDSSIVISSTGTGTDAINIDTTAGSIDIDSADNITVDAADEISITTTSSDGHISLVSAHTAGTALHIDADAHAGSVVDIDAGILDMDVTGTATITTGGLTKFEATGGVEIENGSSSGAPALLIDNDDTDKIALDIDAANIDANVIDVTADAVTTAKVINVTSDALTTGSALYIDDNSADTGTRNVVEIIQNNPAAIAATALDVQSDGGITGVNVKKNFAGTANATIKGIIVDVDKTEATTSDNTIYGSEISVNNTTPTNGVNTAYGEYVTCNLRHAADAGTIVSVGGLHQATSTTNGSSTTYGLYTVAEGADTNIGHYIKCDDGGTDIKLVSSADTADYFSIATTANGATTLTTVDAGAAAAHLTLEPDGNLVTNSPLVMTKPSVTNLADDGSIPITEPFANIDANGGARTGIRFAGAGTAGQFLVVNNTGGEALTFHNTEGTALFRGINADHDTMEANFMGLFVSDGTYWNIIAGGVDSQPDVGLTAS